MNNSLSRIINIWKALEVNPVKSASSFNEEEATVCSHMGRLIGEELVRTPFKLFPLDAYSKNSNNAILEIKSCSYTMEKLSKNGPQIGAFIPHNKITYLQLACGLISGIGGRREKNCFQTGYFCYLLDDGIFFMTIQQIMKKIFQKDNTNTVPFRTGMMKANSYGIFFTKEHWTKL